MALHIEGLPNDFCPNDCPLMDARIEDVSVYMNNGSVIRTLEISCSNETVCRMWAERDDHEKQN